MKKLFTIFLALTYLLVSSGIVVNTHYCMGKLAGVSYQSPADSHCGLCGMDNTGCCHNDLKLVKLDDSHKFTSSPDFRFIAYPASLPAISTKAISLGNRLTPGLQKLYTPLFRPPSPTILHAVFRI